MSNPAAADAATLLRQHRESLGRMPVTLRAFIGMEAEKWPTFFPPEKAYLTALLESLASAEVASALASVTRVEAEAGCREVREAIRAASRRRPSPFFAARDSFPAGDTRSIRSSRRCSPGSISGSTPPTRHAVWS